MEDTYQRIQTWNALLADFAQIPKPNIDPTFMEICQMGGDRFEERCSQILQFYLSPAASHKLRGLLLSSLLEALKLSGEMAFNYDAAHVQVLTEETTADGKRIDITVITDSFVIAIENKIWASLYNPLDSYVNHINCTYKEKKKLFVLLSLRRILDTNEHEKLCRNGFILLSYHELLSAVKANLGLYAADAHPAYLTFLLDFIRTIEKKDNYHTMEHDRFFFQHQAEIDELISYYDAFKTKVLDHQKERISLLKTEISQRTQAEWWTHEKWDFGISFNEDGHRIGIESSFHNPTADNPIGDFTIYITVWKRECFAPYEQELKAKFPDKYIDYEREPDRVYLHLPVESNDNAVILNKLEEYYNFMKELTGRIK